MNEEPMSNQNGAINPAEEKAARTELEDKYLTFFTDGQLYGVPIADVVQIIGIQEITQVPEFPQYAKGIINLRGSIIPVIDIRLRIGKMEREYDERTCIIVTQMQKAVMGFIVDAVDAVTNIHGDDIAPPPVVSNASGDVYLTGVAKYQEKIVLLMNTAKILSDDTLAVMSGQF